MRLNKGIRIALWLVPFVLFYAYIWKKGFEYPVVDDIMINQTILSHENMLLPYVGIGLSTLLVALQKIFQGWNIYFIFLVLSYCGSISIFNDFFYKKKLYILIPLTLLMQCVLIKYFSFSVISYLVAAAGILLLFNQSLVMGILTVAIGVSIRPQIASSLIVLVLPFLIYEILKNKKWKEMLILIGIVLSINVSNKVYSMTQPDVQDCMDQMVAEYKDGSEIVYGVRDNRDTDSAFKRITAEGFYKVMHLFGADVVFNHADYRLVSKRFIQELKKFKEVNLFLRGIMPLVGFKYSYVTYKRHERIAGESHYPLAKMLGLAIDGITSLSIKPIRIITAIGVLTSFFSFALIVWVLWAKFSNNSVAGWASTYAIVSLLGGVQLISLGVIGEYIGKIYLEAKERPRYIIGERTYDENE